MKKSRFSEQQIISILKQADAGVKVQELCRQHGISDATYYKWKSKYGGMEASDIKRLREVEGENSKLKRMFADLALENRALKDLIEEEIPALMRWAHGEGFDFTLIETMPLGEVEEDRADRYLPLSLVRARLEHDFTLTP